MLERDEGGRCQGQTEGELFAHSRDSPLMVGKRKRDVPVAPTIPSAVRGPTISLPARPAVRLPKVNTPASQTPSPTSACGSEENALPPTQTCALALSKRLNASLPLKHARSAQVVSPPHPPCSATLPRRASEDYDIADLQDSLDDITKHQAKLLREHTDIQAAMWDLQHKFRLFAATKGKGRG